jgi:hypothetical protein
MYVTLILLSFGSFVAFVSAIRITRAVRRKRTAMRSSAVADFDHLDDMLAAGQVTTEQHAELLRRFTERRREAGLTAPPRAFDVLPAQKPSPPPTNDPPAA